MHSNGAKIMDLSHTQPKLLDTKHVWGRKFQTQKSTLEVRGHLSTRSRTHRHSKIGHFGYITPFDAFKINSLAMFVVEDILW